MLMFKCSSNLRCFGACAKTVVFFYINNISKQRGNSKNRTKITSIIANICTRGPQSLSSLRTRRDHDPALHLLVSELLETSLFVSVTVTWLHVVNSYYLAADKLGAFCIVVRCSTGLTPTAIWSMAQVWLDRLSVYMSLMTIAFWNK